MAAAMQTESQIISSFLIRDDRETSETKREEEEGREEKEQREGEERGKRRERIIHLFIVVF